MAFKRPGTWRLSLTLTMCAVLLALSSTSRAIETAYFIVGRGGANDVEAFVIAITDPQKIAQARAIIAGTNPAIHVAGEVRDGTQPYNTNSGRQWRFYFDSDSIQFMRFVPGICSNHTTQQVDEYHADLGKILNPQGGPYLWCPKNYIVTSEMGTQSKVGK